MNLAGMVHPNTETAHVLSELGKVGVRLAPIVALVAPLFLVQRVVVVDEGALDPQGSREGPAEGPGTTKLTW